MKTIRVILNNSSVVRITHPKETHRDLALGGVKQPNLLWSSKSREPVPMLGYRKSLSQRLGRSFRIKKTRVLIRGGGGGGRGRLFNFFK